jgi:hypothetical protein
MRPFVALILWYTVGRGAYSTGSPACTARMEYSASSTYTGK